MALDTQTFSGVSAEKWTAIKDAVRDKFGIEIGEDVGEESTRGLVIGWQFDGAEASLQISVEKRSWYDPSVSTLHQEIHDAVAAIVAA